MIPALCSASVELELITGRALSLAAVDKLHVQGVSDHEGNVLLGAAVGEPIPAEHALDANDDAFAERCDGLEQGIKVTGEVVIEDDGCAQIQFITQ